MIRSRLEALSDGVIAIILTIMMLDLKVPPSAELSGYRLVVAASHSDSWIKLLDIARRSGKNDV